MTHPRLFPPRRSRSRSRSLLRLELDLRLQLRRGRGSCQGLRHHLDLRLDLGLDLALGLDLDLGLGLGPWPCRNRLGDGADPVADVGASKRELPPPWTGKSTRDLPILPVCPLLELGRKSLADLPTLPAFRDSVFSHCWRRDWHLGLELRLGPEAPSLLGICPSLGGLFP